MFFFFFLRYFSFDSRRSLGLGRAPTRDERGEERDLAHFPRIKVTM